MSAQATEIAYLPLAHGIDLTTGDAQRLWDETLRTISEQPGCNNVFWGRQLEHPDTVQLVVEWNSLESHLDFMASHTYGPFFTRIRQLLSGSPKLFHVKLPAETPFSKPGSAPVTECLSFHFDPDFPNAKYDANFESFKADTKNVPAEANESQGITGGWGLEEQQHEKFGKAEGEEGPAKFFGVFVGWPTVEAHMKFRQHEACAGLLGKLKDGPKAVSVHHVAFQKY